MEHVVANEMVGAVLFKWTSYVRVKMKENHNGSKFITLLSLIRLQKAGVKRWTRTVK